MDKVTVDPASSPSGTSCPIGATTAVPVSGMRSAVAGADGRVVGDAERGFQPA